MFGGIADGALALSGDSPPEWMGSTIQNHGKDDYALFTVSARAASSDRGDEN